MSINLSARLAELNLTLPGVPKAVAQYVPALRSGSHVFVSGQLPMRDGQLIATGSVPSQVSLEDAQQAARQCVLNGLAAANQALDGDWSDVVRVARLAIYVSSDADFFEHHKVANGASELVGQLFGEAGVHARAAMGVAALPLNAPVEVEMMIEVR